MVLKSVGRAGQSPWAASPPNSSANLPSAKSSVASRQSQASQNSVRMPATIRIRANAWPADISGRDLEEVVGRYLVAGRFGDALHILRAWYALAIGIPPDSLVTLYAYRPRKLCVGEAVCCQVVG